MKIKIYNYLIIFLFIFSNTKTNAQKVALNFDGINDYVQTTYAGISGTNARTIEAWIRTKANADPGAGGKQQTIVDYGTFTTGARFTFNVLWGNAVRIEVGGSGLSGQTVVNDSNWHHVAVTFDNTASNKYSLYVDGVLDTAGNIATTINTGSSINLKIGERIDNTNNFKGNIDDVRVYNFAKTQSQIAADMDKELCTIPSSLLAYYKLNEGTPAGSNSANNSATDYSGYSNGGTLNNFALSGDTSNWTKGANLSGGNTDSVFNVFACIYYTSPSGNYTWFQSGTYNDVIANAAGCDSLLTYNLTIGQTYTNLAMKGCDSIVLPSGRVVFQSGAFRDTLKASNRYGCDSTMLILATVTKKDSVIETIANCDSVFYKNTWYYANQQIVSNQTSAKGCDSIHIANIVINKSTQSIQTVLACNRFTTTKNRILTVSGIFQDTLKNANALGCDSVVIYNLTVNYSSNDTFYPVACDSFISPTGNKYLNSGTFTESFKRVNTNCDSINVYVITINKSKNTNNALRACDSALINGNWYNQSQVVQYTLQTVKGCDSVINTQLTIDVLGTSVYVNNKVLTAYQSGAAYQWINCEDNQPIAGATNQSYAPIVSGSFAVNLKLDSCTKQSNCHSVFFNTAIKNFKEQTFAIIPNPNNGTFGVDIANLGEIYKVMLLDYSGKLICNLPTNLFQNIKLDGIEAGIYVITIQTAIGNYQAKLIIN